MTPLQFYTELRAKGLSEIDALEMAAKFEANVSLDAMCITPKSMTPGAIRTRRHREKKDREAALQIVTGNAHVTPSTETESVTERHTVTTPLSPALSPQTPQTHPQAPVDNTTREVLFAEPEEPKPKEKRGTRLTENWLPDEREIQLGLAEGLTRLEIESAAIEFRNYWIAQPGRNALKLDWRRTWHNCVIREGKRKCEKLARQARFTSGGGRGANGLGEHLMRTRAAGGN